MLKSVKDFTISFTGTQFGELEISQLVSDGTAIVHGWVTENGSVQAGLNGGSTTFENANNTYQITLTFPQDNLDVRTLQRIVDYGKNNQLVIGNLYLNDGGNNRSVESASAFISSNGNDETGSDVTTGKEFVFTLPNAVALSV